MLYLVPTPIGNLDDMTVRAIKILQKVDLILAEDTRTSGHLIKHYQIETRMSSYHAYNEHKKLQDYMNMLKEGINIALITDAGTPGISDPGFLLVRAAIEQNIPVEVLPGATAVIPALVGSGFSSERYVYLGFPPQKKGRQTFWLSLAQEQRTMVMYESPHRILKALKETSEVFGPDRRACVVRELTKMFETYHRGTLSELLLEGEANKYKGEIVLVIEGAEIKSLKTKK